MNESQAFVLQRETKGHGNEMAVIARTREDLRYMLQAQAEKKLADGEHFRYACLAMAALGQRDDKNPHRDSRGQWVKVGPYVSQAVTYVLIGVETTPLDRELVLRHAQLINVSRRMAS